MTRNDRRPSLLDELRDLRRRISRLEASSHRTPPAGAAESAAVAAPAPAPGGLIPARVGDWWRCDAPEWEAVGLTWWERGTGRVGLLLSAVADSGTSGEVRLTLDGHRVGPVVPVTASTVRETRMVDVSGAAELRVEARRDSGSGYVRVACGTR
ncbi:hypothetical protein FHX37_3605 [Haloactinospora alba]|uniref:Uncharacterized protein n=1 Tax=Haloactinospora alba TaxID=405555 RepID=A0A543N8X0_9ACTN|nr:hypothetical protein [Haloactinospora alba]TQN28272.1 hypothetical protein FHX37_3605 [Haloactinospora alba]